MPYTRKHVKYIRASCKKRQNRPETRPVNEKPPRNTITSPANVSGSQTLKKRTPSSKRRRNTEASFSTYSVCSELPESEVYSQHEILTHKTLYRDWKRGSTYQAYPPRDDIDNCSIISGINSVIDLDSDYEDKPTKYYTELLCLTDHLDKYVDMTDVDPVYGEGNLRNCFGKIWKFFFKRKSVRSTGSSKKASKSEVPWHPVARWVKYFEITEAVKNKWSKPHVTTLSPYYIQKLRDNLEIKHEVDEDCPFEQPNRIPHCKDEVYQSIYLNDKHNLYSEHDFHISLEPLELKWIVSGGTYHDRFEIGRAIGGIFSCEEYKLTPSRHSLDDVRQVMEHFLQHSTLVPFNSWDPRFRMMPLNVPENVPKWLDPAMKQREEKEHHKVEGGLIDDFRNWIKRYRGTEEYRNDWIDGLHLEIISAVIFGYFINITQAVTFGAMTQSATDNYIGTVESVVGAGMCGIMWHFFSGQPLIILSQTGHMLLFDKILYSLTKSWEEVDFLDFRLFVGIWTFIFCMLVVVFRISKYVTHITNFTEECFAALISIIFIVDGFKKIAGSLDIKERPSCDKLPKLSDFDDYGTNKTCSTYVYNFTSCEDVMTKAEEKILCQPDEGDENEFYCQAYENCKVLSGYFGILLSLMTLGLCFFFRSFRKISIFHNIANQIANFGVVLAIVICIGIDRWAGLATFKLHMPTDIMETTKIGRPWWVLSDLEWSTKWFFVAMLPALLCMVLLFIDQQITGLIINRPENKLKKDTGYHLDFFVVGIMIIPCSLLGLPFYVASVTQSITYMQSLRIYEEDVIPGRKVNFKGCIEQRLSGVLIFILVFCSVFASSFLIHVPLNILYGVFVYMGVTALLDLQLLERSILLLTPQKFHPDYPYLRKVKLKAVHMFTLVQLVCLAVLYVIKSLEVTALGFGLLIIGMALLVAVRKGLNYLYSKDELAALDH